MTVRWVESARGGGTPDDRGRPARVTPVRAAAPAGPPAGNSRRAPDERDRR
ncbi:hypothetical protein ACWED2_16655 [Amycolatopsis sp. NPDC005003]